MVFKDVVEIGANVEVLLTVFVLLRKFFLTGFGLRVGCLDFVGGLVLEFI